MGKNVTLEIDEAIYRKIERLAKERGEALVEALEEIIEAYLEQRKAYANDSFFQIGKAGRSGLGDLAREHDRYLYGADNEKGT